MPRKKKTRLTDIPPQTWLALPELQALHALNRRCFAALVEATRANAAPKPTAAIELLRAFANANALDAAAAERAGRCPVILVYLHFQEGDWWERIAGQQTPSERLNGPSPLFLADAAAPLLGQVLMEAWSIGRRMPQVARLLFGMSPAVVQAITQLSMRDIERVAHEHACALRPRWEDNRIFWTRLFGGRHGGGPRALDRCSPALSRAPRK